jgi:hypothetical protein
VLLHLARCSSKSRARKPSRRSLNRMAGGSLPAKCKRRNVATLTPNNSALCRTFRTRSGAKCAGSSVCGHMLRMRSCERELATILSIVLLLCMSSILRNSFEQPIDGKNIIKWAVVEFGTFSTLGVNALLHGAITLRYYIALLHDALTWLASAVSAAVFSVLYVNRL